MVRSGDFFLVKLGFKLTATVPNPTFKCPRLKTTVPNWSFSMCTDTEMTVTGQYLLIISAEKAKNVRCINFSQKYSGKRELFQV